VTRKKRRLYVLLAGMGALGVAATLVLLAFRDNLVFFYSPSDIAEKHLPEGRRVRIGGLVEENSVARQGKVMDFRVTDGKTTIAVTYAGAVPDLFREGQGVVAEGRLRGDGVFAADSVLAKHDEAYMPPEVADALKRSGHWQPSQSAEAKK
jgi:cytochrome c-type biogenesis protein CcmE